jgi:hypothetical protein
MSTIATSSLIQYRQSVIHQLEEDLVVRINFDSRDALSVEMICRNVKQFQPGDEVLGNKAGTG